MTGVCELCHHKLRLSNPGGIRICSECCLLFPFNYIASDVEFKYNLHSFFHSNYNFNLEKLLYLKVNPLDMNDIEKDHDIDKPLTNFEDINFPFQMSKNCKYMFCDEFHDKFKVVNQKVSILHVNARSLRHNFDDLLMMISTLDFKFTAIAITETWFNSCTPLELFNIPGYKFNYSNRTDKIGGGVALYVDENVNYIVRSDLKLSSAESESLFIEIREIKRKPVTIGCVYRAPNTDITNFIESLEVCFKDVNLCNDMYLVGDFNINLLNADTHCKTDDFLNVLFSNNMYPLITKPTRISSTSATLIDNIFTNVCSDQFKNGILYQTTYLYFVLMYQ